ncbi:hypothetical protein [Aureliella helgolandensis]|uniref:Uncharacterized protein n=1 Tax=Aureliella helgolandensis TaxID=2527968 RepID=A0A518GF19_9BACT|nr:hypothetical protein [Aureliella helgolandensis]QDV27189.1 hypothetical protein Q31a_55770 [Aureliella helgolandensis]
MLCITRCFKLVGFKLLLLSTVCGLGGLPATPLHGQANQSHLIRYKLKPGETLVSKVVHFAETRTVMSDLEEESTSRTTTEKVWEVTDLAANGDMTFEYRINSVSMAQTVGEGEELSYDSQSDAQVPDIFKHVAETIAKPLALITINARGQIVKRDKELQAPQLGIGELTIPLPEEEIGIAGQWSVPRELRVKLESGAFKTIKVRELYTLEKVSAGVATISIVTQPLTPVNDAAVEAQLIQQLSRGEIKFDLDQGRMLSKSLVWKDEVLGFRGAETSLSYDGKFTEELLPATKRTAARAAVERAK